MDIDNLLLFDLLQNPCTIHPAEHPYAGLYDVQRAVGAGGHRIVGYRGVLMNATFRANCPRSFGGVNSQHSLYYEEPAGPYRDLTYDDLRGLIVQHAATESPANRLHVLPPSCITYMGPLFLGLTSAVGGKPTMEALRNSIRLAHARAVWKVASEFAAAGTTLHGDYESLEIITATTKQMFIKDLMFPSMTVEAPSSFSSRVHASKDLAFLWFDFSSMALKSQIIRDLEDDCTINAINPSASLDISPLILGNSLINHEKLLAFYRANADEIDSGRFADFLTSEINPMLRFAFSSLPTDARLAQNAEGKAPDCSQADFLGIPTLEEDMALVNARRRLHHGLMLHMIGKDGVETLTRPEKLGAADAAPEPRTIEFKGGSISSEMLIALSAGLQRETPTVATVEPPHEEEEPETKKAARARKKEEQAATAA